MGHWTYKKKAIHGIEDFPANIKKLLEDPLVNLHIIYCIKNKVNGMKYYGRKIVYNNIKKVISLRQRKLRNDRKRVEYVKKESDWKKYYGSSKNKEFVHDFEVLGPDKFDREILLFTKGKKEAAYQELKTLLKYDCLRDNKCYNLNILGKFFKKDTEEI